MSAPEPPAPRRARPSARMARRKARATPISCWMRSASRSAATSRPSACGAQPARASAASGGCTCRGVWRAKSCADRHRANSPNTRAIPRGASRSAQATRCLPPLTARRSCRTSTAGAATARSRTSATSSSSPMPRPGCTTRAARCASRSTCRSTSVDTVYAHIRYSDKPFMGSVTSAARAADSIEMCRLLFGADFVGSHCVILGNVNVNSPLVLDGEASRVIRTYAAANQAPVCVPFIDRPAGAAARRAAALRRESLRVQDRRCPGGLRERELDVAGVPRGRELRAARGGLARGGAGDVLREIRHGRRSVGCVPYELADNNSFEQWSAEGGRDLLQRANRRWKSLLEAYQPPPLDPARDEALREYVTRRKRAMPDEPG